MEQVLSIWCNVVNLNLGLGFLCVFFVCVFVFVNELGGSNRGGWISLVARVLSASAAGGVRLVKVVMVVFAVAPRVLFLVSGEGWGCSSCVPMCVGVYELFTSILCPTLRSSKLSGIGA